MKTTINSLVLICVFLVFFNCKEYNRESDFQGLTTDTHIDIYFEWVLDANGDTISFYQWLANYVNNSLEHEYDNITNEEGRYTWNQDTLRIDFVSNNFADGNERIIKTKKYILEDNKLSKFSTFIGDFQLKYDANNYLTDISNFAVTWSNGNITKIENKGNSNIEIETLSFTYNDTEFSAGSPDARQILMNELMFTAAYPRLLGNTTKKRINSVDFLLKDGTRWTYTYEYPSDKKNGMPIKTIQHVRYTDHPEDNKTIIRDFKYEE